MRRAYWIPVTATILSLVALLLPLAGTKESQAYQLGSLHPPSAEAASVIGVVGTSTSTPTLTPTSTPTSTPTPTPTPTPEPVYDHFVYLPLTLRNH